MWDIDGNENVFYCICDTAYGTWAWEQTFLDKQQCLILISSYTFINNFSVIITTKIAGITVNNDFV